MLMTDMPNNYNLSDEDYYNYGFDRLTSMEHYNKSIFNLLRRLSYYCSLVNSSDNVVDRRSKLEEVYGYIWQVTNYVVKNSKNEVISKDIVIPGKLMGYHHRWKPSQDLEMMFHFERIENYNLDCNLLINYIKDKVSSCDKGKRLVKRIENK